MIERELEVLDRTIDETGEVAVELANLRDDFDELSPDVIKLALIKIIKQVDSVADVLTALSVDLAKVNYGLDGGFKPEIHDEVKTDKQH